MHKSDIWEGLYEDGGIDASWLVWKLDDALRSRGKRVSADFEARSYAGILLQGLWIKTSAWSHEGGGSGLWRIRRILGNVASIVTLALLVLICSIPIVANATESLTGGSAAVQGDTSAQGETAVQNAVPNQDGGSAGAAASSSIAAYAHRKQGTQSGITLAICWNEPTLGQETDFHVVVFGASSQATVCMEAPRYVFDDEDDDAVEIVADFSQSEGAGKQDLTNGTADYAFTMAASGTYRFAFCLADPTAGVADLEVEASVDVADDAYPSVAQVVSDAVEQCKDAGEKTDYDKALWLHDWLLKKAQHDESSKWVGAEAALTRGTGTSQAYASAYTKLLDAAGIENAVLRDDNANAWNVVKLDGRWYHVDCFLDDVELNSADTVDLRHLYFGLTDTLIAKVHPPHADRCRDEGYATPAISYECNYYVKHGEAKTWANSYKEGIQKSLDDREEEFFVEYNSSESVGETARAIINEVVGNVLQNMQWTVGGNDCTLEVTALEKVFSIKASYEALDAEVETASEDQIQPIAEEEYNLAAAGSSKLTRLYGYLRYNTMEALVNAGSWSKGGSAILASGENYPDALAAASLAGVKNAPILLTYPNKLASETSSRLSALEPTTVYIVGGTGAVSGAVEQSVRKVLPKCSIVRVAGQTRIQTSIDVASKVRGSSSTAIIATGNNYADALSVSPYAFKSKSPVFLCDPTTGLSADALAELSAGGYKNALVVGGTAAVPSSVEGQLRTAGISTIKRLAGSTRYSTSGEIVRYELSSGLGFSMNGLLLATGENFPDALAAGPLAGRRSSPLLLVDPSGDTASSFVGAYRGSISYANIVGGPAAISNPTATKVGVAMGVEFENPTYYGFQNPSQYYQVSNISVNIPHLNQGIFGYRTPSKLSLSATRQDCINAMISTAWSYVGTTRYIWDYACAPRVGVDCAGLVMQCLYATGMDLGRYTPWDHYYTPGHNHYANDMWNDSRFKHVSFAERQPGDLVCYPGHIAIYIGNDRIIEAYSPAVGVRSGTVYVGKIRGCLRPFV